MNLQKKSVERELSGKKIKNISGLKKQVPAEFELQAFVVSSICKTSTPHALDI